MSDEAALLNAITAHAGDDTPRLVYADWLDEHDAPIQAEFIRTQCRLASCSAADPEYPDLLERSAEVALQFGPMLRLTAPQLPPGFKHENDFRRGFLHSVSGNWETFTNSYAPLPPTDEQIESCAAGLSELIANTTARHLRLTPVPASGLARILAEPAARALTGLAVYSGTDDPNTGDEFVRIINRSQVAAALERLEMYGPATVTGLAALNATPGRLRALDLPSLSGRPEDIARLAGAPWFRGLREVRWWNSELALQEPLLTALAGLPHLESLEIRFAHPTAMKVFGAAGTFPELARLNFGGDRVGNERVTPRIAARLARGRFPKLTELTIHHLRDESLRALLGAKWVPQIRAFSATEGHLTGRAAVALSRSALAPNLRILRVGWNKFPNASFGAFGNGVRFPRLTTLELPVFSTPVRPQAAQRFAGELSLPHVRHLDLDGWLLGDAGTKALAANPHLANLTRLSLADGRINDRGFTALARSKHLRNLIELEVGSNSLKRAAALLDPEAFPRLAKLGLYSNPIAPADRDALHRARGWLV